MRTRGFVSGSMVGAIVMVFSVLSVDSALRPDMLTPGNALNPVRTVVASAKADPAVELFEKECSVCHRSGRAKSKRKTREEWEKTVLRMKNVNGARITEEQARTIIDHLTRMYGK